MNEVAKVDRFSLKVTGTPFDRQIQRPLPNEGLAIGRHISEVIDHHEHLHHCLVRVKESLEKQV